MNNDLMLCNGTDKCEGLITRERKTIAGLEQSIIDFLILCPEMFSCLQNMKIDSNNRLCRYVKKKSNIEIVQSDHNLIIGQFSQLWNNKCNQKQERRNIFNFNHKEGWKKFHQFTSSNTLSACFKGINFEEESRIWHKKLINILHRSFPVIRPIQNRENKSYVHNLLMEKSKLQEKVSSISKSELTNNNIFCINQIQRAIEKLDCEIAEMTAERNVKIIKEQFSNLTEFGKFSSNQMWKMKKKISSNQSDPPTTKNDASGNLISNKKGLLRLYPDEYMNRLQRNLHLRIMNACNI